LISQTNPRSTKARRKVSTYYGRIMITVIPPRNLPPARMSIIAIAAIGPEAVPAWVAESGVL
jgi:hypothetical protein